MWHAQAPLPPLRLAFGLSDRLSVSPLPSPAAPHTALAATGSCNVGKQVGARYAIAASAAALANRAQCMAADGCGGVQSTALRLRLMRLPLAI